MVIEIKDKEIESFLNSLSGKEMVEFVEKAIKERVLIFDAKKAVKEIKENNLMSEEEFFKRINED